MLKNYYYWEKKKKKFPKAGPDLFGNADAAENAENRGNRIEQERLVNDDAVQPKDTVALSGRPGLRVLLAVRLSQTRTMERVLACGATCPDVHRVGTRCSEGGLDTHAFRNAKLPQRSHRVPIRRQALPRHSLA